MIIISSKIIGVANLRGVQYNSLKIANFGKNEIKVRVKAVTGRPCEIKS
jgi:hypothetical protein